MDQEHLDLLKQGTDVWNVWREQHPEIHPELSGADLSKANLSGANLSKTILLGTNLSEANLSGANLSEAILLSRTNLSKADLSGANLYKANLSRTNLSEANLTEANLSEADLSEANLSRTNLFDANLSGANLKEADLGKANLKEADLSEAHLSGAYLSGAYLYKTTLSEANLSRADLSYADLSGATLLGTNLTEATLTGCRIYGIAAWDVELTGATQNSLIITRDYEPIITVDNLKVAQFLYLLLNNQEIRDVIDTVAKKAVLILGRFTPERKVVLDTIREELRKHDYLPILFDFEKPNSRNFTETIRTLAHLSRFIIADLTNPSSIPQELYAIAPTLVVPIQPLLEASQNAYSMFSDLSRTYHWILPIYRYTDLENLLANLQEHVIDPAEQKAQELTQP